MGFFFRNQFDLYQEISRNRSGAITRISKAISIMSGENLEQDVCDACDTILEFKTYDSAFDSVDVFFNILKEKLQVGEG